MPRTWGNRAAIAAVVVVLAGAMANAWTVDDPGFLVAEAESQVSAAAPAAPSGSVLQEIDGPAAPASSPALRAVDQIELIPPVTITAPPTTLILPPPVLFTTISQGEVCVGALPLLDAFSPGWDSWRMAKIMWRESRCEPWARNPNSSATGLLQVLARLHCPWLVEALGEPCWRDRLTDPEFNVRAAAELWLLQGYAAWRLS